MHCSNSALTFFTSSHGKSLQCLWFIQRSKT